MIKTINIADVSESTSTDAAPLQAACKIAVNKSTENRPTLRKVAKIGGAIVATDSYRIIAVHNKAFNIVPDGVSIPAAALKQKAKKLEFTSDYVFIRNDDGKTAVAYEYGTLDKFPTEQTIRGLFNSESFTIGSAYINPKQTDELVALAKKCKNPIRWILTSNEAVASYAELEYNKDTFIEFLVMPVRNQIKRHANAFRDTSDVKAAVEASKTETVKAAAPVLAKIHTTPEFNPARALPAPSRTVSESAPTVPDSVRGYSDLTFETIGTWLWCMGNTKEHKEELKAAGFKFSGKQKRWYMPPAGTKRSRAGKKTYAQIKEQYSVA